MGSVALAALIMQPVAPIPAPAVQAGEVETRTIDYSYDPLYRLTAADYDDGTYFHYSYDAVGNRLSEGTNESSSTYTIDVDQAVGGVDGVAYTWDANGNLLSDGDSSYSYNTANRLMGVSQGSDGYSYAYNGLGDRLQQVVNGDQTSYTLDLNTGLTQVLADGSNTYLYGLGRIGELQPGGWMYHLPDALGSVRQLSGPDDVLTQAQSYAPFGDILVSSGNGQSVFQYTGEARDSYIKLIYLRSRYYATTGRFLTKDSWQGDYNRPLSLNHWNYVEGNPINYTDQNGNVPFGPEIVAGEKLYSCNCGWIDLGHAGSHLAMSVINLLNQENVQFANVNEEVRSDVYAINPGTRIRTGFQTRGVSIFAVVKKGFGAAIRDRIELGIYRALQEQVEDTQGEYLLTRNSSYSFEDLSSDEIGFYLAKRYNKILDLRESTVDDKVAWEWLSQICGFPQDRRKAIDQSLAVYVSFGGIVNILRLPKVKEWGKPILCDSDEICMNSENHWPSEFSAIAPILPQRGGLWRFFDENLDDFDEK